jgi:hypothetical protein
MNALPGREQFNERLKVFRRPSTRDRCKEVVDRLKRDSSPGLDSFTPVVPSRVIAMLGPRARELERDDGRRP